MFKHLQSAALVAAATLACIPATASAMQPPAGHDWSGPYLGAHLGLSFAQFDHDSSRTSPSGNAVSGDLGGMLGYNFQSGPHVFGIEADGTYMGLNNDLVNFGTSHFSEDFQSTIRGRYGYALGAWLPYLTAGIAFTETTAKLDGSGSSSALATGFAGGVGTDVSFGGNWSGRAEFLVTTVPQTTYTLGGTPMSLESTNEVFRIGVAYHFGDLLK
ncbi:MAG TPA: outer membrane beta-barrel protein [Alphaproteobacteria bacterium]|nr:outer membrane beta-barrel protein [Alphaproteobacteria bacterium]